MCFVSLKRRLPSGTHHTAGYVIGVLAIDFFFARNVLVDYGFLVFPQGFYLGLFEGNESVDFGTLIIEIIDYGLLLFSGWNDK